MYKYYHTSKADFEKKQRVLNGINAMNILNFIR